VSTTSFDHWDDQRTGLVECTRVLAETGHLIIADLFSPWLIPTLRRSRKDKARTKARANRLLTSVGLRVVAWHDVVPLIKAVVATPPVTAQPQNPRTRSSRSIRRLGRRSIARFATLPSVPRTRSPPGGLSKVSLPVLAASRRYASLQAFRARFQSADRPDQRRSAAKWR
jgi:hypothetical protein